MAARHMALGLLFKIWHKFEMGEMVLVKNSSENCAAEGRRLVSALQRWPLFRAASSRAHASAGRGIWQRGGAWHRNSVAACLRHSW